MNNYIEMQEREKKPYTETLPCGSLLIKMARFMPDAAQIFDVIHYLKPPGRTLRGDVGRDQRKTTK